MARKLRIEYPGAIYHVMNRGDRREDIFRDDQDRQRFLDTLAEACQKTDWQALAWCLMPNHFHLIIETPKANLVAGMKWFLGAYTSRFNRRHKLFGHLFSGRYKALIVDGGSETYLRTVCEYVHLNPIRAKMVDRRHKLSTYRWSSYGEYLKPPGKRLPWLRPARLLGAMGIPKDSPAGRVEFERQYEMRRWEDQSKEWEEARHGWCLGSEAFRKELLTRMAGRAGASYHGEELKEASEEKAERLVVEEMKKLRWTGADLEHTRKGDPRKVKIARRLRSETTMTLQWIATRLNMGTWTHVSNRLYHLRK